MVVKKIADTRYQERVWLGASGTQFDSWEETMCQFFDDFQADRLLMQRKEALGVTDRQYLMLLSFKEALEQFAQKYPASVPNEKILKDPEWKRLTETASDVRDAFEDFAPQSSS